jgi:hypothetical protein
MRGRIRRVKRRITLVILVTLSTWMALAEDFTTVNGREYKDATVSHVEPDGIVLKTKSGISKVYFSELPKEVQERFVPSTPKMGAAQRGLIKLKSLVPTVANPTSFVLLSIGAASLVVVGLFGIAKAVMRRPKRIDRPSVARKRGL